MTLKNGRIPQEHLLYGLGFGDPRKSPIENVSVVVCSCGHGKVPSFRRVITWLSYETDVSFSLPYVAGLHVLEKLCFLPRDGA